MDWRRLADVGASRPSQVAADDYQQHSHDGEGSPQEHPAGNVFKPGDKYLGQQQGNQRISGHDGRNHHDLRSLQRVVETNNRRSRHQTVKRGESHHPQVSSRNSQVPHRSPACHWP